MISCSRCGGELFIGVPEERDGKLVIVAQCNGECATRFEAVVLLSDFRAPFTGIIGEIPDFDEAAFREEAAGIAEKLGISIGGRT